MTALITGINVRRADAEPSYFQNKTFNQALEGVFISDFKGNLQFVNEAFASLHGYNEKELHGKHLSLLHTEEQMMHEVIPLFEKAKAYGHSQGTVGHTKKNGTIFYSRMALNVLKDDHGAQIGFIVIVDVGGDNIKPEKHQPLKQNMQIIETSTRKIVHDFNNFLHVIAGNIETTIKIAQGHTQIQSNLEEVLSASRRAQGLVQEILSTTGADNTKIKPLQVPLVVRDTLRLLRASLPVSIEVNENICKENGLVLADPVHIQRIIMNLCTNGSHAMEQTGGRLNVTVAEVTVDSLDTASLNLDPGAYVRISVSDNGHGIEPAIMNLIFEPYFTTRGNNNAQGLGLCIIREIVDSYRGHIRVYSEPGEGTVIDVYLPRIDHEARGFETDIDKNTTASLHSS